MTAPLPANQIGLLEITNLSGVSRKKASDVATQGLFGFPAQRSESVNRKKLWDRAEVMQWLSTHDLKTLIIHKQAAYKTSNTTTVLGINSGITFLNIFAGMYDAPEVQQDLLLIKIRARNNKCITTLNPTGYPQ